MSVLGILTSAILFYLAVRGVDWSKAYEIVWTINGWYMLFGAVIFIGAYAVKWYRWHYILLDLQPDIQAKTSAPPFFISFLVNNILPLRAGEVFRIVLLAKKASLQKRKVTCTLIVDRIFDGLALVILLGISISRFVLPVWVASLFYTSLALFLGSLALLYLFLFINTDAMKIGKWIPEKILLRLSDLFRTISEALGIIKNYKHVLVLLVMSLVVWIGESMMYYLFAQAFHLPVSYLQSVLIMAVVNFGIMIPSSPGYVGTFQFFCVKTMELFGVAGSQAIAYAVLLHLIQYLILSSAGGFFVLSEGFSFQGLRKQSVQASTE